MHTSLSTRSSLPNVGFGCLILLLTITSSTTLSCGDDSPPSVNQPDTSQTSTTSDTSTTSQTTQLECVNDIDCQEVGVLCLENECKPAYCRPGARFCEDGVPHICDDSAQSSTAQDPCPSDKRCNRGDCIPLLCNPGEIRCEGTSRLICNDLGTGFTARPCQGQTVCFNAECVDPVCEPSTLSCISDLTLGRCNEGGGGYDPLPCAFAQRCLIPPTNNPNEPNPPTCAPFHALTLIPQSSLTSNARRPDSGSISFWITLELPENPDEVPPELQLLQWIHPNGQGLQATFDTTTSTLTFTPTLSDDPNAPLNVSLLDPSPISSTTTSHLTLSWTPNSLSIHLNGLPLAVDHPLLSPIPLGTPADLLSIGRFSESKSSWQGRLTSILVSSDPPTSSVFTPHCDHTHTRERTILWNLDEGDGNTALSTSDVPGGLTPSLSILSAPWTGGLIPRFTRDADGDFFGLVEDAIFSCIPPADDFVLPSNDCNDGNNTVYPGAPELQDQIDNDCDDLTDE